MVEPDLGALPAAVRVERVAEPERETLERRGRREGEEQRKRSAHPRTLAYGAAARPGGYSRPVADAIEIGEAFEGTGAEAAHVNTVLGPREGPVGTAWATALATPSAGHTPFVCVLRPGLPTKPLTFFVNKAAIAGDRHASLTWGAAQAGVAGGVADAVAAGAISEASAERLVLIAAVWVAPDAEDADAVYRNNRLATRRALEAGRRGEPRLADVLAARDAPENPFYPPAAARTR